MVKWPTGLVRVVVVPLLWIVMMNEYERCEQVVLWFNGGRKVAHDQKLQMLGWNDVVV